MDQHRNIEIIILAAGASTRFGSPKQLAKINGETLLEKICKTSISTGTKTYVILGANAQKISKKCRLDGAEIVVNENWENGLSSSIKSGLKAALKNEPDLQAIILLLCDQPFIKKETIENLVNTFDKSHKNIVASSYDDTLGTPALFSKEVFGELLMLEGDRGAKSIIKKYRKTDVEIIAAPEAAFDIDTKEDFELQDF